MQKQLERRIVEVEKMKQQEREEGRKAVDAVEKQVSPPMLCVVVITMYQMNMCNVRGSALSDDSTVSYYCSSSRFYTARVSAV